MDRFTEMQVFVAVVDAGSFTAAADRLDLSRAAVSRHVAALEQRLGVRLLNRTTRSLSLTGDGERFHGRASALLGELAEAEAELAGAAEPRGRLRINVPVSYGLLRLAGHWPEFMARFPLVRLDVTLSDRLVDLVEEGYDLAVRIGRLPSSSLVARRLATTRLVLCAAPDYIERHGAPESPADLARHAVLAYSLFSAGDRWRFDGPNGSEEVKVSPVFRSNSGDTLVAAAVAGRGIVLQPTFLVARELDRGQLTELLPGYSAGELGVHAVYPAHRHMPSRLRALVDFLVEAHA
ncbi:LysR family transcriptional regulator [Halomonas denitrificans]|nr:LysR family transcriptional regulator [Halomonas denitrificans]